jgi:hypothetical protein
MQIDPAVLTRQKQFMAELDDAKRAARTPFIEDFGEVLSEFRRRATTPAEKAWCDIELALCHWRTIHDTTEQLFGDPNWWRM